MSTHPSKDRTSWCLFAFKDGRRCRLPRAAGPYLCNFHTRREAEQAARQRIGRNISVAFSGDYLSESGLSIALARTLAATAQGQLQPKQAALIACLGRTILQAIPSRAISILYEIRQGSPRRGELQHKTPPRQPHRACRRHYQTR
jgi:hypothetical protein